VILGGMRLIAEIAVRHIEAEIVRFERMIGTDPDQLPVLRGTTPGAEIVVKAGISFAREDMAWELALCVLWMQALGPDPASQGWSGLEDLGGRTVRAVWIPGQIGWHIQMMDPNSD
jgi:hypothetical protein